MELRKIRVTWQIGAEHQAIMSWMLEAEEDIGDSDVGQPLPKMFCRIAYRFEERLPQLNETDAGDLSEQGLFVRKVGVRCIVTDADFARERTQREVRSTVAFENVQSSLNQCVRKITMMIGLYAPFHD